MITAALIVLRDEDPEVRIVGLDWVELRMRQAVAAGARHLVVVPVRMTPPLLRAADRLRSEGVSVTIARTSTERNDVFHPDETVFVMSGSAVVDAQALARLEAAAVPAILCVASPASPAFELIDAAHRWVGFACISGAQICMSPPMAADWDAGSVVLREAVRARATRVTIEDAAVIVVGVDPDAARRAARRLIIGPPANGGWGHRQVFAPAAVACARILAQWLPAIARIGPWAALGLLVAAPLVAVAKATSVAAAVLALALLTRSLVAVAGATTGIVASAQRMLSLAVPIGVAITAAIITYSAIDHGPLMLAIALAMLLILLRRRGLDRKWQPDLDAAVLALLAGSFLGTAGIAAALGAVAAHAFVDLLDPRIQP